MKLVLNEDVEVAMSIRLGRTIGIAACSLAMMVAGAFSTSAQIEIGSVLSITGPASFLGDPDKKTYVLETRRVTLSGTAANFDADQRVQEVFYLGV